MNASSISERSGRQATIGKPGRRQRCERVAEHGIARAARARSGRRRRGRSRSRPRPSDRRARAARATSSRSRSSRRHRQDVAADERVGDQVVDRAAEARAADVEQRDPIGEAGDLLEALRRPQHRDRAFARPRSRRARARAAPLPGRDRASPRRRAGSPGRRGARAPAPAGAAFPSRAGRPACAPRAASPTASRPARARVDGLAPSQPVQAAEEDEVLERRDPQVEGAVAGGHESQELACGAAGATPFRRTLPSSGVTSPLRIRSSVVLPAPFGPSRAWIWPGSTPSVTPDSAARCPKRFVTPATSIASGAGAGRTSRSGAAETAAEVMPTWPPGSRVGAAAARNVGQTDAASAPSRSGSARAAVGRLAGFSILVLEPRPDAPRV